MAIVVVVVAVIIVVVALIIAVVARHDSAAPPSLVNSQDLSVITFIRIFHIIVVIRSSSSDRRHRRRRPDLCRHRLLDMQPTNHIWQRDRRLQHTSARTVSVGLPTSAARALRRTSARARTRRCTSTGRPCTRSSRG